MIFLRYTTVLLVMQTSELVLDNSTVLAVHLKRITKEMFNMTQRNSLSLNLSYNRIDMVADGSFEGFDFLKLLNMSHNYLITFHANMLRGLPGLQILDLRYNYLKQLHVSVMLVPSVKFYASHNFITDIDVDIDVEFLPKYGHKYKRYKHMRLQYVDLSYNNLTHFELWPYLLPNIKYVDLRHNHIVDILNTRKWRFELSEPYDASVDFRFNNFTKWNDTFFRQYQFNDNFHFNDITLYKPDFRNNSWICDCNFFNIKKQAENSIFGQFEDFRLHFRCSFPKTLEGESVFKARIDAFVCNITSGCPEGCWCRDIPNQNTTKMDCSDLGLHELPKTTPKTKYNRLDMDMSNNSILRLENRPYLGTVVRLNLKNNHIQYIDNRAMSKMTRLEHLNVANNQLRFLPRSLSSILAFGNVHLQGNSLICNCNMMWMVDWVKQNRSTLKCTTDEGKRWEISELTPSHLECFENQTLLICGLIIGILVIAAITAVSIAIKCPYEFKVLIFSCTKLHPADKYKIDEESRVGSQIYISCDEENDHVRQWVLRSLVPKLKLFNPHYNVFVPVIELPLAGCRDEDMSINIRNSKRILIVLSNGYFDNDWNLFETAQAELLAPLQSRIVFILYDEESSTLSQAEPWKSRISTAKVLSLNGKLFWSKLKYELPS